MFVKVSLSLAFVYASPFKVSKSKSELPFAYTFSKMASEYSFITVSFRFYTQVIRSHRVASLRVLSKSGHFGKSGKRVAKETMHDNNTSLINEHVPSTVEFNQIINDF